MDTEPHAAAMTLFRLVGAGTKFSLDPQGVKLMVPKEAQSLVNEAEAHARGSKRRIKTATSGKVTVLTHA
jgi:hypothetical protein